MVYSAHLAAGTASSTPTTVYTSPANVVTVVRDIEVVSNTGAAQQFNVYANVSGFNAYLYVVELAANYVSSQWKGRVVLAPGDFLQVYAASSAGVYCISGYQLTS